MLNMTQEISKNHSPNLETVLMVEKTISKKGEFDSRHKLWRSLPKQVQYQTFKTILTYLENSNKIMLDKKGAVIWIFTDSPKLEQLHKISTRLR
jgi:hypothetical protein